MGKRPYYIIKYVTDYDGYDDRLMYLGTNYKAACNRYLRLVHYLKKRHFLDEGVAEHNISLSIGEPPAAMVPGNSVYTYMNDNDSYYLTVSMRCIDTNRFMDQSYEDMFRQDFPDSKY